MRHLSSSDLVLTLHPFLMTSCVHTMPLSPRSLTSTLLLSQNPDLILTIHGILHIFRPSNLSDDAIERTYKRTRDPQLLSELKSVTHRYHNLLATAKKKFYSSLVHSRSSNPRLLWKTINQLLHRNSSSPLPSSLPPSSIAESFCS